VKAYVELFERRAFKTENDEEEQKQVVENSTYSFLFNFCLAVKHFSTKETAEEEPLPVVPKFKKTILKNGDKVLQTVLLIVQD